MAFPGPDALGRGVVVAPGAAAPPGWDGVERAVVDDRALAEPAAALARLHPCWSNRRRVVVELAVDAADLKEPATEHRPPYLLEPDFELPRERLHFLVWANTYDARRGPPRWWHGVRAARLGAAEGGPADVVLPDGRPAWCDGGPRRPLPLSEAVVHRDSIDAGRLSVARHRAASADLDPDQLAAVAHPGGPARIIAPAGSGKTRVLTERLRHLIGDRGHEADLVTAVAYNVKAAEELRDRTRGFTPTIRTLNSLGLHICRMAGDPRVIEEREVRALVESLTRIPHHANTDTLAPYLEALSAVRLGLVPPRDAELRFPDAAGVAGLVDPYRRALADRGAVDFDEQIYRAVELCLTDPAVRARARASARTLLVDEFQDLTPAHVLLIRLLAGPAGEVFGVGDDDQVIYGYAGADPGFLVDFDHYFPGASSYQLRVNYRCPVPVVGAARALLAHNRRRVDKQIAPAPGRAEAEAELQVREVESRSLARAVGDQVATWLAGDPAAGPAIAVLARVSSILLPVQVLLTEAGIACTRAVGTEILSRTGTAAALAYLRLGLAPDAFDAADVALTVRRPSRRIARNVVDMLTRRPRTSLADVRRLARRLSGDDAVRVAGYAEDLEAVAAAVRGGGTAPALAVIRTRVGLGNALDTLDSSRPSVDRSSHGDDLWALEQVAALHPEAAGFEAWLRATLSAPAGEGVHLSTVHKVKGREWPRVIVFGASAELFPHRLAHDVEEERRVFHVALTRARQEVVVVADAARPSPFLAEMAGLAPSIPASPPAREPTAPAGARPARAGRTATATPKVAAAAGLQVVLGGGTAVTLAEAGANAAVALAGRARVAVPYGTAVAVDGRTALLVAPEALARAGFAALKVWRTEQARREGVPAYVVMSDAHLQGIAERRPGSLDELARCPGIGPAKLTRYGDEILAVLDGVEA